MPIKKINKSGGNIKANENSAPASRARFRCPVNLARIMELLNLISVKTIERYNGLQLFDDEDKLTQWIQIFQKLPAELKNYIRDFVEVDRHKTKAAKNFYYDYQLVFENLLAVRALLEHIESIDKKSFRIYHGGLPSGETLAEQHSYHFTLKDVFSFSAPKGINSPNYSSLINVEILPDSTMNFTLSPLLYAISKADTRRIRQCRFCRKFFWAERYDALGCSPRCSNALRQRKLREFRMTPIE